MRGRSLVLHPYLLAIYPILSLYVANIDRLKPLFALRTLLLSLSLSLILIGLFHLLTRDWSRAGLITSLFLVLFFSYGHVYALLEGQSLTGFVIGRHRTLLFLWVCTFVVGGWWIFKRLKDTVKATALANVIALVALVMPIFKITSYYWQQASSAEKKSLASVEALEQVLPELEVDDLPDVYYIILDAYARQDVLLDLYGYDNSQWLDDLRAMGFYIGDESLSNYEQTALSITSALSMDYLQTAVDDLESERTDYVQMLPVLKHSIVRNLLESLGYKTAAFATGYKITDLDDAELYLEPGDAQTQRNVLSSMSSIGKVNPFEVLLVESTAAVLMTDYLSRCVGELDAYRASTPEEREQRGIYQSSWLSKGCVLFEGLYDVLRYPFREHRERIQYMFDTLPDIAEIHEPVFLFAHIISPHFPFVFGADGEVGSYLEETGLPFWYFTGTHTSYVNGYVDQLTYVNKRMLAILQDILANSESEPIIIVQADHGPDSTQLEDQPTSQRYLSERFPILNAYYLPSTCKHDQLYPSITPVNSFRVIFNACFGADYELLEDRNYSSFYDKPYDFKDVTQKIKP
jgi:hypothetical protein